MEFLRQQAFEHQHKEYVSSNLDRGCFDRQMLEDSIDQNLGMLLVEMRVVAFVLVATKGSSHQDYNPNLNLVQLWIVITWLWLRHPIIW